MSDDLSIPNSGYRGSRAGRYGTGPIRPGMDPDTRRLMMFAGGLGGLLAVLVGASALVGRHSGEVPVVVADARPIREKPLNPGGMKIDGAENDLFSGGSDTAEAKLAPAPESPDTKALHSAAAPPPPVAATPAATAVAIAPPPPVTRPVVAASVPVVAKPTPVKPPVAVAETHPAASAHKAIVQLAALTSEEAAHNEWQQLSKRMPDLLSGRQPNYSRTDRDGHTFWRVRTAGFADVAQARTFCEHVRAKGAACSVADC